MPGTVARFPSFPTSVWKRRGGRRWSARSSPSAPAASRSRHLLGCCCGAGCRITARHGLQSSRPGSRTAAHYRPRPCRRCLWAARWPPSASTPWRRWSRSATWSRYPNTAWTVTTRWACHNRGFGVFTPRKLDPVTLSGPGQLWGYLQGGHQYADYYLARDGTPTQAQVELHGKLFARLGLDHLDRRSEERLAAGCHPLTGERLVKTSHVLRRDRVTGEVVSRGGAHVPGIDCNLSPPKSVSAVLPFVTVADRAGLEAAHLAAVRVTVRELEHRVAACRPTIDGQQIHTPGELAIATFTHHTSRPSPEVVAEPNRPPDPQLHSHVFVFNLAWCEPRPGQGRFLAVDSRPIFQFGATAEAIYSCELAAQLQRLGYQLAWHQTRKGQVWELSGVDERLCELFSSRHRHIV